MEEKMGPNPLANLPEKERAELFTQLRDCPYHEVMVEALRAKGIETTAQQLKFFYHDEARHHWETRIARAALEANALIQLAEENPTNFSSGILAALGQEAFRQIASGQAQPEAINKMALLFLRAKADERADQLGELKREKLRLEIRGNLNLALEQLSDEVNKRPAAREKFEALRNALTGEE